MKTAVSIPDEVFEKVERLARRTHKSRNEVFSAALGEYVAHHAPDEVTETMNRVYEAASERPDPFLAAAVRRTLERSTAPTGPSGCGSVPRQRAACARVTEFITKAHVARE
jgi:Ribbon-helix-helix protein, copG family